MGGKGGGTVTRVDFRKRSSLRSKLEAKGREVLTFSMPNVRLVELLAVSLFAAFLIWVGVAADNLVISIFMIGFGILTILRTITRIVRKEIEDVFHSKED